MPQTQKKTYAVKSKREVEIYFSTDVEADGPIPGRNSMMSLGSVAFRRDGSEVSRFYAKLLPLPEAKQDEKTMEFWNDNPEAWAEATRDPRPVEEVMQEFHAWIIDTCNKVNAERPPLPIFVGYPGAFDFMFVQWYLMAFVGEDILRHAALDMKSFAMALRNLPFRYTSKRNMPARWFEGQPVHDHIAVNDAAGQGMLFIAMLKAAEEMHAELAAKPSSVASTQVPSKSAIDVQTLPVEVRDDFEAAINFLEKLPAASASHPATERVDNGKTVYRWSGPGLVRGARQGMMLDWKIMDGYFVRRDRPHSWLWIELKNGECLILDLCPADSTSGPIILRADPKTSPWVEVYIESRMTYREQELQNHLREGVQAYAAYQNNRR